MNLKQAKRLRRMINRANVGLPLLQYTDGSHEFRSTVYVRYNIQPNGTIMRTGSKHPRRLAKSCTRRIYQDLKKINRTIGHGRPFVPTEMLA